MTAEAAGCTLPDVCHGLGHELEEGTVSGSHSVGRYLRFSGLRAVPAVRGLCGWPVPAGTERLARPVYASLEGLVGREGSAGAQALSAGLLEDMADALFGLSSGRTPELARGGRLRPFVQLWLASQVLYYERRAELLGEGFVPVRALQRVVRQAGLCGGGGAHGLLCEWGRAVRAQFLEENGGVLGGGSSGRPHGQQEQQQQQQHS